MEDKKFVGTGNLCSQDQINTISWIRHVFLG